MVYMDLSNSWLKKSSGSYNIVEKFRPSTSVNGPWSGT